MSVDNSIQKGIVYEAFVRYAFELQFGKIMLWEPELKNVIANQDLVYPTAESPEIVFAVTYWDSHEAAKMKFWRTVEDCYETVLAYPKVRFVSVVFEKNKGSDDALDALLNNVTSGCELSECNSANIIALQGYADTDEKIIAFGRGKDLVYDGVKCMASTCSDFMSALRGLGAEIGETVGRQTGARFSFIRALMKHERRRQRLRKGAITISGIRSTYYKTSLIKFLRFPPAVIAEIIKAGLSGRLRCLSQGILDELECLKLIKRAKIGNQISVSDELKSMFSVDPVAYAALSLQIKSMVDDATAGNDFHNYIDHYYDIVDKGRRCALYQSLSEFKTPEDLLKACHGVGLYATKRVWIVDYYLAIKRVETKGKYGMKKLSAELGIPYIGGISRLPRYVRGESSALSASEERLLFSTLVKGLKTIDLKQHSAEDIAHDRSVTLMKQFDLIELLIRNAFVKGGFLTDEVIPGYRVSCPFRTAGINANAGVSEFNYLISRNGKQALLFVVSAYDSSHKHKEASGRIRAAKDSVEYPSGVVKTIIVLDGILLEEKPKKKLKMFYQAGWDEVYYVDELDKMTQSLASYFSKSTGGNLPSLVSVYGPAGDEDVVIPEAATAMRGDPVPESAKSKAGRKFRSHKG